MIWGLEMRALPFNDDAGRITNYHFSTARARHASLKRREKSSKSYTDVIPLVI